MMVIKIIDVHIPNPDISVNIPTRLLSRAQRCIKKRLLRLNYRRFRDQIFRIFKKIIENMKYLKYQIYLKLNTVFISKISYAIILGLYLSYTFYLKYQ